MSAINYIGLVGSVLTLGALILAAYQLFMASNQTKKLQDHSESLGNIANSLSTRYIGKHPEYLSLVNEAIKNAKSEVMIVNSQPCTSYFSNHGLWLDYKQIIQRKSFDGVEVSLICMDETRRREILFLQFPKTEGEWKIWSKLNEAKIEEFLTHSFPDVSAKSLDKDIFADLLIKTQNKVLADSHAFIGVKKREISHITSVEVWIVDQEIAILSILTLPGKDVSHGFQTTDKRLVSALHSIAKIYEATDPVQHSQ